VTGWALWITVALYAYTAVDLGMRGSWPMAAVFVCYAGANVAMIFAAYR